MAPFLLGWPSGVDRVVFGGAKSIHPFRIPFRIPGGEN